MVVWDSAVTEGIHQSNTMSEGLIVLSTKKILNKAQMARNIEWKVSELLCVCYQWNTKSGLFFFFLMKQSVGPQTCKNYFKQHQERVYIATSGTLILAHANLLGLCWWFVFSSSTENILWNWYLCLSNVSLFLFLQIQYIQICFHCPGVCGDIYLHLHVSKAGGKYWFTNHLYSLLAMGPG